MLGDVITPNLTLLERTSLAPSSVPLTGVTISHEEYFRTTLEQDTVFYFVSGHTSLITG